MTKKLLIFFVFTILATTFILVIAVSTGYAMEPSCLNIAPDPRYFMGGAGGIDITVTGNNTHFVDGTTEVYFDCPEVTVGTVTVKSPTELTVSITTPADGYFETCDSIVTTGNEVIKCYESFTIPVCTDHDSDCYTAEDGDCDDNDSSIYPGADEDCCNDIDDDCDGLIDWNDEDCSDGGPCPGWCLDCDDDGYTEWDGGGDCDDSNSNINPGAEEICDDGIDNDCDRLIDWDDDNCPDVRGTCVAPSISPSSATVGRIFPRFRVVTITTGRDEFDRDVEVSFGTTDIKVIMKTRLGASRLLVFIVIAPKTIKEAYDLIFGDCVKDNAFTIL